MTQSQDFEIQISVVDNQGFNSTNTTDDAKLSPSDIPVAYVVDPSKFEAQFLPNTTKQIYS